MSSEQKQIIQLISSLSPGENAYWVVANALKEQLKVRYSALTKQTLERHPDLLPVASSVTHLGTLGGKMRDGSLYAVRFLFRALRRPGGLCVYQISAPWHSLNLALELVDRSMFCQATHLLYFRMKTGKFKGSYLNERTFVQFFPSNLINVNQCTGCGLIRQWGYSKSTSPIRPLSNTRFTRKVRLNLYFIVGRLSPVLNFS